MARDEGERELNPYAASPLYEPKPKRPRIALAPPLVARGQIDWPTRKQAFLMTYGVTLKDVIGMTVWTAFPGSFILTLTLGQFVNTEWLLAAIACVWLLVLAYMLARRYFAVRAAGEQQAENAGREIERVIDGDGVRVHGASGDVIPWPDFAMYRQRSDLLVLILRDKQRGFQIYPRAHFATAGDWGLFCKVVEHYVQCV